MNIIVSATGQVGSNLIREIKNRGFPVRAVVRNPDKLADKTIETRTADLVDAKQLIEAFRGGTTVFLLTPENPTSTDIIEDTKRIVDNYKKAVRATTGIKKVVALLNKNVAVQSIPQGKWRKTLLSVGFTDNAATNLLDMTQAVIDNKTIPEQPNDAIKLPTTLEAYLKEKLKR